MTIKTFAEVLKEEYTNQFLVVAEMDAKLKQLVESPNPDPKEVMRLMLVLSDEKRILLPLKKVIDAYNRGVLK